MRGWRSNTVWNPAKLANVAERYQSIYTTLFPVLYALYFAYGAFSLPTEITSIDALLGPVYGDFWSTALMAGGLFAFLGQVIRPGLRGKHVWQQVELAALSLIIVLESLYVVTIIWSGLVGAEPRIRWLAALAIVVYVGPPLWKARDTIRGVRAT